MKLTGLKNLESKRVFWDAAAYIAGSVIYALSVNMFSAPNNIAPGGVTGIATLLNYLFGLPIGTTVFVINIPLLWATWRFVSRSLAIRSSLVTLLVSAVIDLTAPYIPPFRGDKILTVLFGGLLTGIGVGLIYMRGATTGGSELAARLLGTRFKHLSIGRLILLVDAFVVISAAFVYRNIEAALYATILIYVGTVVMDGLVYGSHKGRMLLIVTSKGREIAAGVMNKLGRGVTIINATGAYTGEGREVLLCAVRPPEVHPLRTIVADIDPNAFVIVTNSEEIVGEGFININQQ